MSIKRLLLTIFERVTGYTIRKRVKPMPVTSDVPAFMRDARFQQAIQRGRLAVDNYDRAVRGGNSADPGHPAQQ